MRNRTPSWMALLALVVLSPSCMTNWAQEKADASLTAEQREQTENRRRMFLPFALISDVLTWPFLLSLEHEEEAGEEGGC